MELESQDHGAVVGGADPGCGAPGDGCVEVVAGDGGGLFEGVAFARGPVLSLDFDADAAAFFCSGVEVEGLAVEAEGWGPEFGVVVAHQTGQPAARPGGPGHAFAVPRRGVLVRGRERPVGDADAVAGQIHQSCAREHAAAVGRSAWPGFEAGAAGDEAPANVVGAGQRDHGGCVA